MKGNRNGWHKVGTVWVDSGQLMLCDPCYLDTFVMTDSNDYDFMDNASEERNDFSYNGACNVTLAVNAGQLQNGAVVTKTTYGDGTYNVYVLFRDDNPQAMTVVMNDQIMDKHGNLVDEEEEDEPDMEESCYWCGNLNSPLETDEEDNLSCQQCRESGE